MISIKNLSSRPTEMRLGCYVRITGPILYWLKNILLLFQISWCSPIGGTTYFPHKIDKDGFYKVRPIFNNINEEGIRWLSNGDKYSVDEVMIPYFGRHSSKQFICNKPNRYGYKVQSEHFHSFIYFIHSSINPSSIHPYYSYIYYIYIYAHLLIHKSIYPVDIHSLIYTADIYIFIY